jgi:hypothetical protein
MKDNIHVLAFATFGTSLGFRQHIFYALNPEEIEYQTFDLNTNAIIVTPNAHLYAIRKENMNGTKALSYIKYAYLADRNGSFIGNALCFVSKIALENTILAMLNESHQALKNNNTQQDRLQVNQAQEFAMPLPKDFDKLPLQCHQNLDEIYNQRPSQQNLVIYSRSAPEYLQQSFKKALFLLNKYDVVYFTESKEIIAYVKQKQIFECISEADFDTKIQSLKAEEEEQKKAYINQLQQEKTTLSQAQKNKIQNLKQEIDYLKTRHKANQISIQEAENQQTEIDKACQKQIQLLAQAILKLENLKLANHEKEQLKTDVNIAKKLFNGIVNQDVNIDFQAILESGFNHTEALKPSSNKNNRPKSEKSIFKMLSAVLAVLCLFSWAYIIFYQPALAEPESNKIALNTNVPIVEVSKLNPKPDTLLTDENCQKIAKKIRTNMPIDQVVEVVFDINPKEVKQYYQYQKEDYAQELLQRNTDCFDAKSHTFNEGSLMKYIPAYKGFRASQSLARP